MFTWNRCLPSFFFFSLLSAKHLAYQRNRVTRDRSLHSANFSGAELAHEPLFLFAASAYRPLVRMPHTVFVLLRRSTSPSCECSTLPHIHAPETPSEAEHRTGFATKHEHRGNQKLRLVLEEQSVWDKSCTIALRRFLPKAPSSTKSSPVLKSGATTMSQSLFRSI